MASYLTIAEAQAIFDERLNTDAWDDATESNKTKALAMATKIINQLNFIGDKVDDDQANEFPRGEDTEAPDDILNACAEIALALLDGVNPEMELEALSIEQMNIDAIKSTYDRSNLPEHIIAGIPSSTAWRYLKPYLRDNRSVDLHRVS